MRALFLTMLAACAGPLDVPPPQHTGDTADPAPPCQLDPCVADLAGATADGPGRAAGLGYALATDGQVVIAGAPAGASTGGPPPAAHWLGAADLAAEGSWEGFDVDMTGAAVALADVGGDGVLDVAVGRPNDHGVHLGGGAAHLLLGPPDGTESIEDAAVLTVVAESEPLRPELGDFTGGALLLEDFGTGAIGWAVGAPARGEVWWIDPALRGTVGRADATRVLTGPDTLDDLAAWDGDCDGAAGIATATATEVLWFAGPWDRDLVQGDADGAWGGTEKPGHRLRPDGDLDGDGCVDLIAGSLEHDDRAGGVFVVPGGAASSDVGDLPVQVLGDVPGEAIGYAVAAGDVDGDGADDLLVGAASLTDGPAGGAVRLFLGPLDGTYAPGDADLVLHAEQPGDILGREMVVVDADGDTLDDVVLAADGYGGHAGRLYLVTGADWTTAAGP